MKEIIEILMRRDGNTKQEAIGRIKTCQSLIYEAVDSGEYWEAEDILMDELGLEMDYIIYLL